MEFFLSLLHNAELYLLLDAYLCQLSSQVTSSSFVIYIQTCLLAVSLYFVLIYQKPNVIQAADILWKL